MTKSHFRLRTFSAASHLALSLLFVTAGIALNSLVARAQDSPSTMQKVAVSLTTDPSPAHKGANTVRVKLTKPAGQPITGAEVTVTFFMPAMPSMGMAAMKTVIKAISKGGGIYEGKGDLDSGGKWQVTIAAHKDGKTIAAKRFTVNVTAGM